VTCVIGFGTLRAQQMERTQPMKDAGKIELEHFYAQSPAAVWKALTDPKLLAQWWAPGNIRALVGHHFDLDMGSFGKQPCEVLEVEPEKLLKYKFGIGNLDTVITWTLTPENAGTRLKLTHDRFDMQSPIGRQASEGMKAGWPNVLQRLEAVF
jgi:uncharacterized protein YndB with AHSA1/START domain